MSNKARFKLLEENVEKNNLAGIKTCLPKNEMEDLGSELQNIKNQFICKNIKFAKLYNSP